MSFETEQCLIDILREKIKNSNFLDNYRMIKLVKKHKISQDERNKIDFIRSVFKQKNPAFELIDYINGDLLFKSRNLKVLTDIKCPYTICEVFHKEMYKITNDELQGKNFTVLDLGANRGYASLYFAEKSWCKNIYAFEMVPETAEFAMKSISYNSNKIKNKIHFHTIALGKEDLKTTYYYDGFDYSASINKEAILKTHKKELSVEESFVYVKKSSEVLRKIIEENKIEDIILKIDVEGAEYDIMEDLKCNYPEIFDKIQIIVGETHLGFEKLADMIKPFNYKTIWTDPNDNGACPFKMIKE